MVTTSTAPSSWIFKWLILKKGYRTKLNTRLTLPESPGFLDKILEIQSGQHPRALWFPKR